jgi:hypothetical protein
VIKFLNPVFKDSGIRADEFNVLLVVKKSAGAAERFQL